MKSTYTVAMYELDDMTIVDYDPSIDAMALFPECSILKQSTYVETFDFDGILIDIGDLDNIRTVEILHASRVFHTTIDVLSNAVQKRTPFSVKYESTEEGENKLIVAIKGFDSSEIRWNDNDME